jgi:hypothetical protein
MTEESRSKTQKRLHSELDISGALALGFSEKTYQALSQDADNALKRPWHKLERGLRIGRLREFVAREKVKQNLCEEDSSALFKLLTAGLDRKMLSSKAAVTYDHEEEKITEINGLVPQNMEAGRVKYQLLEKRTVGTQKKRSTKETPTVNSDNGAQ